MQNKAFYKLLIQLEKLTFIQSKQVEDIIHKKCSIESLEDVTGHSDYCPHCNSKGRSAHVLNTVKSIRALPLDGDIECYKHL